MEEVVNSDGKFDSSTKERFCEDEYGQFLVTRSIVIRRFVTNFQIPRCTT